MTTAARPPRRRTFTPRSLLIELWLPVVLVAVWWFGSQVTASTFFPSLADILDRAIEVWVVRGHGLTDLLPSLANLGIGFGIALVLGVALGTTLALVPPVLDAVEPELEFLRAIPAVAVLPVAIIAIGLGDDMRVAVIAFGAIWPVLVNTIAGVKSADPVTLDLARAFRLGPLTRLFRLRLPAALPQILAGSRTALSVAVVLIVVSEMSGAARGIGHFVLAAQRNFAITDMWTGMVVLGLVGYLLNLLFRIAEARILHWHPAHRAGAAVAPARRRRAEIRRSS